MAAIALPFKFAAPSLPPAAVSALSKLAAVRLPAHAIGAGVAGLVVWGAVSLIHALGDPAAALPIVRIALPVVETAEPRDDHAGADHHGHDHDAHDDDDAPTVLADGALPPAPIAGLTQPGPGGVMPRIGEDGRRPSRAYARPAPPAHGRPRIGMLVGGLGLSARLSEYAIRTLPPDVTLAVSPYAADPQTWIDRARADGHEVVLEAPMEPFDYPANDPGPQTLLAAADPAENLRRLDWIMARGAGYFGVINTHGGRFVGAPGALAPVVRTIGDRGLALLFDGASQSDVLADVAARRAVPFAAAARVIDSSPTPDAIDEQLLHLEAVALEAGGAFGIASPYPVSIDAVAAWARDLELQGYTLTPVSALVSVRAEGPVSAARPAGEAASAGPTFATVAAGFGPKPDGAEAAGDGAKPKAGGH